MIKFSYVDAAVVIGRLFTPLIISTGFTLPGEILTHSNLRRKSAEVIVVVGNEPLERTEVSQNSEGPNVKLLQML